MGLIPMDPTHRSSFFLSFSTAHLILYARGLEADETNGSGARISSTKIMKKELCYSDVPRQPEDKSVRP